MELDSLRMSPEKEHNLETLRACFLLELMEKEKCYILNSYNMSEKNAEATA